eukprot:11163436-Lingulodinium_polyedra.AAC.1
MFEVILAKAAGLDDQPNSAASFARRFVGVFAVRIVAGNGAAPRTRAEASGVLLQPQDHEL